MQIVYTYRNIFLTYTILYTYARLYTERGHITSKIKCNYEGKHTEC